MPRQFARQVRDATTNSCRLAFQRLVLLPTAGVRPANRSSRCRVSLITRFGATLNSTLATTHTKPRMWWPYQNAVATGATDAATNAQCITSVDASQ